jgi:hypothetical protein
MSGLMAVGHSAEAVQCRSGTHKPDITNCKPINVGTRGCGAATPGIFAPPFLGVHIMSLGAILLILLVLVLIGAFPTWRYSANWGYFPSGALGVVLVVVIVMLLMGRI